ncbi:hypothetical protein KFK09_023690 [Dendrobium nobile]|uniref:Uncharacterized protein n=1 Tax=Dendrobium nobile TaxID=94219 RepID=A0A8T3AC06_DENNO|nr:hypothetical protein KFK09_023690 [Dendrobium nobile]
MAAMRVLHEIQISPSPTLPSQPPQALSYLDTIWLRNARPVERVFFYNFPHPTTHFIDHNLPNLTRSLSLTLRHFYPLAGSIRRSYDFEDQFEIAYEEGDSITITVAELTGDDFRNISGYHPKNSKNLCLLVPKTLKSPSSGQFPPMTIQITIFPNQGLCIGFASHHAVCDGFGTNIFIQSWAASCRSSKPTLNDISPAFFDRSVIIDSHGIGKKLSMAISQSNKILQDQGNLPVSHPSLVYATFTLRKNHILQLKELVRTKQVEEGKPSYHLSAFVVTCAYVWRCLVKARGCDEERNQYFGISVDWRSRMRPSIPSNYFGNCLVAFFTELKATELVGNDGFEVAALEIGKNIDGLEGREVGELVEEALNKFPKVAGRQTLLVYGSPKLRYYDVDFGWGRPVKVDTISIIKNGAISLAESREEDGGIEIGLVLSEEEMNKFEMNFATSFLDL